MKAQITLPADRHTQCAMGKHLYLHPLSGRAADILKLDGVMNLFHLIEIELPCQHHHIGPAGPEAQRLGIGDIELRGNMNFHANAAGIFDGSYIGRDHRIDPGGISHVQGLTHGRKVLGIQYDIQRQIRLDRRLAAYFHHFRQIFGSEIIGAAGPHVQTTHAEIDRVCASLDSCMQAFEVASRSHYFQ